MQLHLARYCACASTCRAWSMPASLLTGPSFPTTSIRYVAGTMAGISQGDTYTLFVGGPGDLGAGSAGSGGSGGGLVAGFHLFICFEPSHTALAVPNASLLHSSCTLYLQALPRQVPLGPTITSMCPAVFRGAVAASYTESVSGLASEYRSEALVVAGSGGGGGDGTGTFENTMGGHGGGQSGGTSRNSGPGGSHPGARPRDQTPVL